MHVAIIPGSVEKPTVLQARSKTEQIYERNVFKFTIFSKVFFRPTHCLFHCLENGHLIVEEGITLNYFQLCLNNIKRILEIRFFKVGNDSLLRPNIKVSMNITGKYVTHSLIYFLRTIFWMQTVFVHVCICRVLHVSQFISVML